MAIALVRSATGSSAAASTTLSCTLGAAPTAGHLLVLALAGDKNCGTLTLAGFTQILSLPATSTSLYLFYKVSAGTETTINPSWSTSSSAGNTAWYAEYDDVAFAGGAWQLMSSASTTSTNTSILTQSTGTTASLANAGLAIACASVDDSSSVTGTITWGSSYVTRYSATALSTRGAIFTSDKAVAAGASTSSTFTYVGTADQISAGVAVFRKLSAAVTGNATFTGTSTLAAAGVGAPNLAKAVVTAVQVQGSAAPTYNVSSGAPTLASATQVATGVVPPSAFFTAAGVRAATGIVVANLTSGAATTTTATATAVGAAGATGGDPYTDTYIDGYGTTSAAALAATGTAAATGVVGQRGAGAAVGTASPVAGGVGTQLPAALLTGVTVLGTLSSGATIYTRAPADTSGSSDTQTETDSAFTAGVVVTAVTATGQASGGGGSLFGFPTETSTAGDGVPAEILDITDTYAETSTSTDAATPVATAAVVGSAAFNAFGSGTAAAPVSVVGGAGFVGTAAVGASGSASSAKFGSAAQANTGTGAATGVAAHSSTAGLIGTSTGSAAGTVVAAVAGAAPFTAASTRGATGLASTVGTGAGTFAATATVAGSATATHAGAAPLAASSTSAGTGAVAGAPIVALGTVSGAIEWDGTAAGPLPGVGLSGGRWFVTGLALGPAIAVFVPVRQPRTDKIMVSDLVVMTRTMRFAAVTTTSVGAELECGKELTPFSGSVLGVSCLGLPGGSVTAMVAPCDPIPVATALASRGAVVVNSAGRAGIVVGGGKVVQPAGRRYALTAADPAQWVSGWWPDTLLQTVPA